MDPEAYVEMVEIQDQHWWFRGRREIFESVIARLRLPEAARILEIGAGPGGNLEMLSRFGIVQAIERNAYARSIARHRTNGRVDIRDGYLPDGLALEDEYDLVCLFDVLEHVERDRESLQAIGEITSPNGYLLLSVPAYQWLWSAHDERLHHHRRYTAAELQAKARKTGWTVNRISYFNTLLFPIMAIVRILDKILARREPTGAGIPISAVNATLYYVFSMERSLLGKVNLPLGMSLMALLQRR